ncbi:MAG: hypothetical protein C4519_26700 [Desulfobacteraceae bacterium]|nr:MAG: hypothetical protein C4519_26700 [Desulfobacteraceae bacterium]
MEKVLRYILPALGMLSILIFSVSATANFRDSGSFVNETFSEPINILLIGFGLIGLSSFIKRRHIR